MDLYQKVKKLFGATFARVTKATRRKSRQDMLLLEALKQMVPDAIWLSFTANDSLTAIIHVAEAFAYGDIFSALAEIPPPLMVSNGIYVANKVRHVLHDFQLVKNCGNTCSRVVRAIWRWLRRNL